MIETLTKYVLVSGMVQGVGYRMGLHHRATAGGVSGWCRNLPDGRVEALLQGPEESLEVILFWCQKGPPNARVTTLDVSDVQPDEEFQTFEIRR